MTVALDSATDEGTDITTGGPRLFDPRLAGWWARAGAFGIDVLAGIGVAAAALLVGWSAPEGGWLKWACLVVGALMVLAVAANRWLLPSVTGTTLGRGVFGIAVVDADGEPTEPLRLVLRDLAHLLDTLPLFLGWLWPLIDRRERTFADILLHTEVQNVAAQGDPRLDWRRLAARVLAGLAGLAVLAAALGYALIYRQQRADARAQEQIAVEGPKIVADMLSYSAKTVSDDFAKAQNLVTDGYRPELIKQQDAVRKTAVDNDYWVANSAVLSATPHQASMLMLLQGQRGAAPNQRFVTASVRAEFEKAGGNDWKLSNLTVLTAPKSAQPEQKPADQKPADQKPAPPKPSDQKPAPAKPAPTAPTSKAGR